MAHPLTTRGQGANDCVRSALADIESLIPEVAKRLGGVPFAASRRERYPPDRRIGRWLELADRYA